MNEERIPSAFPEAGGVSPCPFCGSERVRSLEPVRLSPFRFPSRLRRCRSCGLFFVDPRPTREWMDAFHRSGPVEVVGSLETGGDRARLFRRVAAAMARNVRRGRVLDAGCGRGYLVREMRALGLGAEGVEPSPESAAYARDALGLPVLCGALEGVPGEGSFDAIVSLSVLDVCPDPTLYLAAARRLLRPGGMLLVRVSNLSFHRAARLLRWTPLRRYADRALCHLWPFSASSLRRFLLRRGFRRVRVRGSPLAESAGRWPAYAGRVLEIADTLARPFCLGRWSLSPSVLAWAEK